MTIEWFTCCLCGYQWERENVEISYPYWFDNKEYVARCYECIEAINNPKPKKESDIDAYEPC